MLVAAAVFVEAVRVDPTVVVPPIEAVPYEGAIGYETITTPFVPEAPLAPVPDVE